ncbi:MAG: hypothetical protein U5K79_22055 [Cyclobacteriaceae bacterium]|nr:hypothetical protein [Cyclobacteriaceae bacterium]
MAELPFREIPESPAVFSAETVAARMIDGLGYRYYWATEGLREEDLSFKPSDSSRTTQETIEHIHGLSRTIVNSVLIIANEPVSETLDVATLRKHTLENLKKASDILRAAHPGDIEKYKIIFRRGGTTTEYPFWNMINGPIEDAVYHTGQVVAFRRASGNPIYSGVRVLTGKNYRIDVWIFTIFQGRVCALIVRSRLH